jgi:type IV secretion system protein VirB4
MGAKETKYGAKLVLEKGGEANIPYTCHVNENTLKTTDGKLVQIIKLEGVAHYTSNTSDLNAWKTNRNFLLRSLADDKFALWQHTIRYKKNDYPAGDFEPGSFAESLNADYKKSLENTEMYANDIYISVVRKKSGNVIAGMFSALGGMVKKVANVDAREELMGQISNLDEATRKILNQLSDYNPKVLSVYSRDVKGKPVEIISDTDKEWETTNTHFLHENTESKRLKDGSLNLYSEPLELLHFLVNGFWQNMPLGFKNAAKTLLTSSITFERDHFKVVNRTGAKVGTVLSIKEYVSGTAAGILDGLMTLPVEFVLTQSFSFISKAAATQLLKMQQARLKNSGDLADSQIDEIDEALDQLISNEFCMGTHHLTLSVLGKSLKEIKANIGRCEGELSEFGLITSKEKLGTEACFWAQLPGNHKMIARKAPITSKNFAGFASLHNYPHGKAKGNHWGEAVALLKTSSKTPYYFNLHHPKDLGNATVIGPSGEGKTVLMSFISSMLEKFKPRQIFFDKDHGSEIYIRAQGGAYLPIKAGEPSGLNPLKLPDTPKNRKFLRDWLTKLLAMPGEHFTPSMVEDINLAINGNYKLDYSERKLSNIFPFFPVGEENSLRNRLKQWINDGDKAWLFDNDDDLLQINNRITGFDVTDFLEDPIIRTPLLMYLFQRIDELITGEPIAITLDEGWNLLDDEYFGKNFKNWLKVIRKLNGLTIFGTQEPSDVTKSAVGATIRSQSPTQIFLRNTQADKVDYIDNFKLTLREFELVKTLPPRNFLIKQGNKSVVAELDLSGMDDMVAVLSGTKTNVELLDDDPKVWLPIFQQRR